MDKIRYTEEVDQQLLELSKSKSVKEIATIVGHSELSVGYRLRKLKAKGKIEIKEEVKKNDDEEIKSIEEVISEAIEEEEELRKPTKDDKKSEKETLQYAAARAKIYPPRDKCKNFDGTTCKIIGHKVLRCIICDTFQEA